MTDLVRDKIVIITGGASGIGRATAKLFAREGAIVIVCDIDDGSSVINEINNDGGSAIYYKTDVTDIGNVKEVIYNIYNKYNRIDIAFNNAGVQYEVMDTPWGDIDKYYKTIDINQNGVLLCMKTELEYMEKQGFGNIVNTASIAGLVGISGAGYCSSKHAVVGLTRSAAVYYANSGIRINCVCPGSIVTPLTTNASKGFPAAQKFMENMCPMKRIGKPEEIANGVLFLASDMSSFVTGHTLVIDGGFMAGTTVA